jgi:hypothetical protein
VATNLLERESPGSTGLFLQGAQGDVNSCVVHKPEKEALPALDVIAARYANRVRRGLREAQPLGVDSVWGKVRDVCFPRAATGADELRRRLAEQEALFAQAGASDEDGAVRMAAVYATALRNVLQRREAGLPLEEPTELQALHVGPITLLGTPFEMFQRVKRDILAEARSQVPLVLGLTNDCQGYAPDRETAARGGYAAEMVPLMKGSLPYDNLHDCLVREVPALERAQP